MPNYPEILQEINASSSSNNEGFDTVRRKYLNSLSHYRGRNVIAYYSGWLQREISPNLSIGDMDQHAFMTVISKIDKSKGLDLILHTPGGDVAATESIGNYLKTMFHDDIEVFIPHLAMSAGTMLACLAKKIYMGYHSSLGPIDPHFNGTSAHGIMQEFQRAKNEIKDDPRYAEVWRPILSKYPPTFLGDCENAMNWAKEIVENWLTSGMFSGQNSSNSTIKKIVNELADHIQTKSHSRHLNLEKGKALGLNIVQLEDDSDLQDLILSIHHSYICAFTNFSNLVKIIENQNGIASITFR